MSQWTINQCYSYKNITFVVIPQTKQTKKQTVFRSFFLDDLIPMNVYEQVCYFKYAALFLINTNYKC